MIPRFDRTICPVLYKKEFSESSAELGSISHLGTLYARFIYIRTSPVPLSQTIYVGLRKEGIVDASCDRRTQGVYIFGKMPRLNHTSRYLNI